MGIVPFFELIDMFYTKNDNCPYSNKEKFETGGL